MYSAFAVELEDYSEGLFRNALKMDVCFVSDANVVTSEHSWCCGTDKTEDSIFFLIKNVLVFSS